MGQNKGYCAPLGHLRCCCVVHHIQLHQEHCFLYNTFIRLFSVFLPGCLCQWWRWWWHVINDRTCLQQVGCSSCTCGDDVTASTVERCSSRVDAVRRRPVRLRERSVAFSFSFSSSYCSASSHRRVVKTRHRKIFTESASRRWQR